MNYLSKTKAVISAINQMMREADYDADMDSEVYRDAINAGKHRRNVKRLSAILNLLNELEQTDDD